MPLRRINAGDIMNREVPMVDPNTPVPELVDRFVKRGDDFVVVVDDEGRPLGVVTERDVMSRLLVDEVPRGEYLRDILSRFDTLVAYMRDYGKSRARIARDFMTTPPVCVGEDTTVAEMAGVMAGRGLRQVCVVREDSVVGHVRRLDIVKVMADLFASGPEPTAEG